MQVVPMEATMEGAMEAAPKLEGVFPCNPAYKQHLCPHGKPGNGYYCPDPGCSGQGLCEHKKQKPSCKECMPAQCPLCNNGKIYTWASLRYHIYNSNMHANVPGLDKQAAYWNAGIEKGYAR